MAKICPSELVLYILNYFVLKSPTLSFPLSLSLSLSLPPPPPCRIHREDESFLTSWTNETALSQVSNEMGDWFRDVKPLFVLAAIERQGLEWGL